MGHARAHDKFDSARRAHYIYKQDLAMAKRVRHVRRING